MAGVSGNIEQLSLYDTPKKEITPVNKIVKEIKTPIKLDGPLKGANLSDLNSLYDTPRNSGGPDILLASSQSPSVVYDSPARSKNSTLDRPARPKSVEFRGEAVRCAPSVRTELHYDIPPPPQFVSSEERSSCDSLQSELHFSVRNMSGDRDIYSRPSMKKKQQVVAGRTNLPPDLPPRNPEQRKEDEKKEDEKEAEGSVEGPGQKEQLASPDYVDVDQEDKENSDESAECAMCKQKLDKRSKMVNCNGELYHVGCFVCAQCFQPFKDNIYFTYEERRYCQHDFQVLFAPTCAGCGEFITGRLLKAVSLSWHHSCLVCATCNKSLAGLPIRSEGGRPVCKSCSSANSGRVVCRKCRSAIECEPLIYKGEAFHPYHFNCAGCGVELTATAREVKGPAVSALQQNQLFCLRCHDSINIPICGACRRPIEERVVTALGKHWHVEHFVCAKCEKPFLGNKHFEKNGLAYCEPHFHQLFGDLCYLCDSVIKGDVFTALNKAWCSHHFACSTCDTVLDRKTKFFEVDLKPVCKKCYEKFPRAARLRLKKYHEFETVRQQGLKKKKK